MTPGTTWVALAEPGRTAFSEEAKAEELRGQLADTRLSGPSASSGGSRERRRTLAAMADSDGTTETDRRQTGTQLVKRGLAEMLKGGVIMDVVDAEQAKIAEDAGAVAVMALERVPSDIRRDGGVARMSDPEMIEEIKDAVTIPVMAKCRIGHFVEAQILEALGVDYIDESEVLTPGRRGPPHRQVRLHRAVRLRLPRTSARRCAASARARP